MPSELTRLGCNSKLFIACWVPWLISKSRLNSHEISHYSVLGNMAEAFDAHLLLNLLWWIFPTEPCFHSTKIPICSHLSPVTIHQQRTSEKKEIPWTKHYLIQIIYQHCHLFIEHPSCLHTFLYCCLVTKLQHWILN